MIGQYFSDNSIVLPSVAANADFVPLMVNQDPAPFSYESLNDYQIIETIVDGHITNRVLKAKKLSTDETWFLALRHGEYSAQVEKAVNEIIKKYVPNTPASAIIKDHDNFYFASKAINNVVTCALDTEVNDITPLYFGYNNVLTHFVGESDIHSGNILISQVDDIMYASHKIDHAESLDKTMLLNVEEDHHACDSDSDDDSDNADEIPEYDYVEFYLEDILKNHYHFGPKIVNHFNYKREQLEIIEKISNTPFEEIAAIIQKYVRASHKEQVVQFMNKIALADGLPEKQKEKILKSLQDDSVLSKIPEINEILKLLQRRHQRYREINSSLKPNKI